jgi:hypothetical protein
MVMVLGKTCAIYRDNRSATSTTTAQDKGEHSRGAALYNHGAA